LEHCAYLYKILSLLKCSLHIVHDLRQDLLIDFTLIFIDFFKDVNEDTANAQSNLQVIFNVKALNLRLPKTNPQLTDHPVAQSDRKQLHLSSRNTRCAFAHLS